MGDKKKKGTSVKRTEYAELYVDDNTDINLLVKHIARILCKRISKSKRRERVVVLLCVEDVDFFQGRKK